jgi:pyruvate dehydrogenase E2 component (dihydrolipoamide acetyltransferase)
MAVYVYLLPDLGEGLTEATILEWVVAEGDDVERDAPLAEVETPKSVVELPAPVTGRVAVLHAAPGETLAVGKPLVTFETAGEAGIVGTVPTDEKPRRSVRLRPPSRDA